MKKSGVIREANGRVVEFTKESDRGNKERCTLSGKIGYITVRPRTRSVSDVYITLLPGCEQLSCQLTSTSKIYFPTLDRSSKFFPKDIIKLMDKIIIPSITIGTDPELFVVDEKGSIIPAFEFLPSKSEGNPFWDGFQAEFRFPGETKYCLAYLTDAVQTMLKRVYKSAHSYNPKARLSWKSVIEVPESMLKTAKKEYVDLGCAPSNNAYPDIQVLNVTDPSALGIRFAGCHIHLGFKQLDKERAEEIVKFIDAVHGPMSILLFRGMEDPRRREFYGRVGEYRLPEWGLEYRVPSSAMISHPALWHLSFDTIRIAAQLASTPIAKFWDASEDEIIEVVNTYDVKLAGKIIKRNIKLLEAMYRKVYGGSYRKPVVDEALTLIDKGALNWFKEKRDDDLNDMEKNWRLKNTWDTHSSNRDCCMEHLAITKRGNHGY